MDEIDNITSATFKKVREALAAQITKESSVMDALLNMTPVEVQKYNQWARVQEIQRVLDQRPEDDYDE